MGVNRRESWKKKVIRENQSDASSRLEGTTYGIGMRSLSQEHNCFRSVHPCFTINECKVPGKDDRRVDGFQKSL